MLGVLGTALLAVGLILATIGLYGLLRMPDMFDQLHAAGMITGPALIVLLLAAVASGSTEIVTSAALVLVFLLVTSPLSGHAIAQAARRRPARAGEVGREGHRRSVTPDRAGPGSAPPGAAGSRGRSG